MPKGEIKQTIKLAGEKEYSAALKAANTQLKTLRSALKAETAELGKNATAQEKDAVKTNNLKKQIQEQEKVVATLTKAFEEAKREYGDNEEVVAKWEQKLNNARATLAGMRNELEGLGDGVQDATKDLNMGVIATKSFADSLASVSSVAGSVADGIESIFSGVINAVSNTVRELWDIISDTAAKANNWTDLAGYYGSSAKEIQKWDHSIEAAGGSFDDFIQLVNTFAYGGKNKAIETWFGVSDANYTDMIQYTTAVLSAMHQMRDARIKDGSWFDAMNEIFGAKKSQKAEWFFGAWDDWFGKAEQWNGEGLNYGLSESELETMNQIKVDIEGIEERWEALKHEFAAGFGEITGTLLINVSGGLDALNKFLKAETPEEREQALADLEKNVTEFFTKLVEAIRIGLEMLGKVGETLSGSDDSLTAGIGKAIIALRDVLEWIIKNPYRIKQAIETIAEVWITGKGLEMANKIGELALNIKTIRGFMGAGGAASGAGGAAAGGGASGGGWLSGMFAGAGAKLSGLVSSLGTLVQASPLFYEAAEQIKANGLGLTIAKWLTLGGAVSDEEAAAAVAAGAKQAPEINGLQLLLDPAGTLAQFHLDMNEADTAAEDLSESAGDAAEALGSLGRWIEQYGDVRWGWKGWSWDHDNGLSMPVSLFTAGVENAAESLEELTASADAAASEEDLAKQRELLASWLGDEGWLTREYGLNGPLTQDQIFALADMFGYDWTDSLDTLEDFYQMFSSLGDEYTWDESIGKFVPALDATTAAVNAMTAAANDLPGAVEGAVSKGLRSTPLQITIHTDDLHAGSNTFLGGLITKLLD